MINPYSLDGKSVLVVGATSGIGHSTAIISAQMGASIYAVGRNLVRMNTLIEEVPNKIFPILCDVNDYEDSEEKLKKLPLLQGLVFCAGTINTIPTKYINDANLEAVFKTNFVSAVKLCSLLLTNKKIDKCASIVFLSSIAASNTAEAGRSIYGASKAALASYARVLAVELAKKKIRVNCVKPGMVRTPFLKNMSLGDDDIVNDEKKYPLGYGTPEDVAYTISFLLSDAAKWITGSEFVLDGGRTLR